jgi:hypothetical protein
MMRRDFLLCYVFQPNSRGGKSMAHQEELSRWNTTVSTHMPQWCSYPYSIALPGALATTTAAFAELAAQR